MAAHRSSPAAAAPAGSEASASPLAPRGCRVPGCSLELSPGYSTKYRICDSHYRLPSMELDGATVRFCQQCGKFHGLEDFEDDRRSCRLSLQRHKARRRRAEARRHQEQESKAQRKGQKEEQEKEKEEGKEQPEEEEQEKGQEKKQKQEQKKEEEPKQQERQEQGQRQQAVQGERQLPKPQPKSQPKPQPKSQPKPVQAAAPAPAFKLVLKRPGTGQKKSGAKQAPHPPKRAAPAQPKQPSGGASRAVDRPGGTTAKEQAQQQQKQQQGSQKRRRMVAAPAATDSYSGAEEEEEEEAVVPQVRRLLEPALSGPSVTLTVPSKPPTSLQQQSSTSATPLGSASGPLHSLPASPRAGPVTVDDVSGLLPDEGELLSWQLSQLRPQQHLVAEALSMLVGSTDADLDMDVPSAEELLEISQDLGILQDPPLPAPQKHAGGTTLGMLGHAPAATPTTAGLWQSAQQPQMRPCVAGTAVAMGVPLSPRGWGAAEVHAPPSGPFDFGMGFPHGFDISAPMASPDFNALLSLPIAPAHPHAGGATAQHSLAPLQRAPRFAGGR